MNKLKTNKSLPTTDSDWTIHSLNIQGTFFERWCQEIIKDSKWKVLSTNYPVEFPKHNGPLIGEQSTLDVYAQLDKQTIKLTLLVECKKNNPEFIDWVFFAHSKVDRAKHFSGLMVYNQVTTGEKWTTMSSISPMISLDWVVTSDAWETRGKYKDYQKGDKTKTSNAAITHAAHQIALATRAIFGEEIENATFLSKSLSVSEKPYEHQILIPTVVTTAKLYTCSFEPKDINAKTGEISWDSVKLQEQPYLLYEYPLPAHFKSVPVDRVGVLKSGNKDFGTRMDILVVNSEKLPEFLQRLEGGNA